MTWWTVRNTSPKRWRPEDGWDTKEQAEKSAKFYRRTFGRRCVVVRARKQGEGPHPDDVGVAVWS